MKNENYCDIIRDYSVLEKVINGLKAMGRKIVLTNGAFDLFHIGHLLYLKKAKEYGDILIVGADSDELVKAIKGSNRPVANLEERISIISALRYVDFVTVNELPEKEDNIYKGAKKLINLARPDVLIVSESTKNPNKLKEEMEEYGSVCGKIEMLPPQATTSTSARIRLHVIEGAEGLKNILDNAIDGYMSSMKKGGE